NATLQRPKLDRVRLPVSYTVTLEANNKPWLFTLDMPIKISIPADFAPDFQVLNRSLVNARLRYNATSVMDYLANLDEPPQQMKRALNLPPGFNPRARQLAAQWRAQNANDEFIVKTALNYFNQNTFE